MCLLVTLYNRVGKKDVECILIRRKNRNVAVQLRTAKMVRREDKRHVALENKYLRKNNE